MSDDGPETTGEAATTEDFEDLFENAPCGYISADKNGRISRANTTLARWIGMEAASLVGKRFSDLLTIGGKHLLRDAFRAVAAHAGLVQRGRP